MTKKLTIDVRKNLLTILRDERIEQRCELVKPLIIERDKVANDYDVQIQIDEDHIQKLRAQMDSHLRHKQILENERKDLLHAANLLELGYIYNSCGDKGIPQVLIDFDIETRNLKKEILER